jgi:hypothetical protein
MFPKTDSFMDEDEKVQYKEYLKSLSTVDRKATRATDDFVPHICALQYITRDKRWTPQ